MSGARHLAASRRVLFVTGSVVLAIGRHGDRQSGRTNIRLGKTSFGVGMSPKRCKPAMAMRSTCRRMTDGIRAGARAAASSRSNQSSRRTREGLGVA